MSEPSHYIDDDGSPDAFEGVACDGCWGLSTICNAYTLCKEHRTDVETEHTTAVQRAQRRSRNHRKALLLRNRSPGYRPRWVPRSHG